MANSSKRLARGHVRGITISLNDYEVHPDFTVNVADQIEVGGTGASTFLKIQHNSGSPTYEGRWDEKAGTVDIDKFMAQSSRALKRFYGHHSKRIREDLREFEIEIKDPDLIFEGTLRVQLHNRLIAGRGEYTVTGGEVRIEVLRKEKR